VVAEVVVAVFIKIQLSLLLLRRVTR